MGFRWKVYKGFGLLLMERMRKGNEISGFSGFGKMRKVAREGG